MMGGADKRGSIITPSLEDEARPRIATNGTKDSCLCLVIAASYRWGYPLLDQTLEGGPTADSPNQPARSAPRSVREGF